MTKPQNITVSLEWARALRDKGYPQDESVFVWVQYMAPEYEEWEVWLRTQLEDEPSVPVELLAAPTSAEIELPSALRRTSTWLTIQHQWNGKWYVEYIPDDGEPGAPTYGPFFADTMQDAMAAMWCHLRDNKLI